VVQAATTGYSLIVDADGRVLQRIPIGQQAVIFADVPLRSGQTLYSRFGYSQFGDLPLVILLIAFVAGMAWRSRKIGLHKNHPPHQVGSTE
jgi:apolipoprotein N-acyltransferase